ncbi:MAG: hypothetical protein HQL95_00515 [Magnetococcales bacterium]|nr:hypothetical protein [Magnetococcales bacterium]
MTDQNSKLQRHLHIIQHSLGRDQYGLLPSGVKEEFRNHYVIGPESNGYDDCTDLVDAGLMTRSPGGELLSGMDIFCVTESGRAFMVANSHKPEYISRSKQRAKQKYQHYLAYSDFISIPFIDFLKMESDDRKDGEDKKEYRW